MKPLRKINRTNGFSVVNLFILLCILSVYSYPQYRPAGNDLWCMEFIDDQIGITIGGTGTIRQTTDGGASWTFKTSGTTNTLKKTSIITDEVIVVAGLRGTIIKTTDQGETWSTKPSGLNADLYGISFGGRLAEVGFVVGDNGTILRSTDQGETWNALSSDAGIIKQVNYRSVAMGSENNGVIVAENGIILLTTNSGISWYLSPSIVPNVNFVFAIMTDANTAFATGNNGTIIRTTNMGESWETISTGVDNTLYRIRFADDQNAISVGTDGVILKTTDGGISWINESSGVSNNLNCLFVIDELVAYTGGADGIILKTTDGGISWFQNDGYKTSESNLKMNEELLSVYPNPSNPNSVINYFVSETSVISIKIFDVLGKELKQIINETQNKGYYSVVFDGRDLSSGMYFCRLTVQNNKGITAKTMKIILVK